MTKKKKKKKKKKKREREREREKCIICDQYLAEYVYCFVGIFSIFKSSHMPDIDMMSETITIFFTLIITNEPTPDKTNKMARALSEDSDQPGHLSSLLRDFVVRS